MNRCPGCKKDAPRTLSHKSLKEAGKLEQQTETGVRRKEGLYTVS